MQADPALVAGIAAGIAALGPVKGELTRIVGIVLRQFPVDVLVGRLGVFLERSGVEELRAVLLQQMLHLVAPGRIRLLTLAAEPLGESLRENSKQSVGEIE